jgi:hypothetical protein
MTLNEIKKILYKENPTAKFQHIRNGVVYYTTTTSNGVVVFQIPVSDMGEAAFSNEMESKFLNRWICQ